MMSGAHKMSNGSMMSNDSMSDMGHMMQGMMGLMTMSMQLEQKKS